MLAAIQDLAALRDSLTTYDATYLALAEALPDPVLRSATAQCGFSCLECPLIDVM